MRNPRAKETGRGAVAMTWLSDGEHRRRTHGRLPMPSSLAQNTKKKHLTTPTKAPARLLCGLGADLIYE